MGININTSLSTGAANKVTGAAKALQRNLQSMAAGLRINSAADDAAGLQMAEMFQTRVRQYTQEANALQTGVNVVQTADAALSTQEEGLGRVRELAIQANNGTLTQDQRNALNQEAQQILQQIDQTAQNTEFNGQKLLNANTTVDLGTQAGDKVTLNNSTTNSLGLNGLDLSSQAGATAALDKLDTASRQISQYRSGLGAQENRFTGSIEVNQTAALNAQDSESRIRDLDVAQVAIAKTRNSMILQQSISALTQGNVSAQTVTKLLGAL